MRVSGPIIMQRFSASRHVFEVALEGSPEARGQSGVVAVLNASWSERHGDTETLISERWTLVHNNIWLATSQKK